MFFGLVALFVLASCNPPSWYLYTSLVAGFRILKVAAWFHTFLTVHTSVSTHLGAVVISGKTFEHCDTMAASVQGIALDLKKRKEKSFKVIK